MKPTDFPKVAKIISLTARDRSTEVVTDQILKALEDAYQGGREDALDEHGCESFGDRYLGGE